MKQHTLKMTPSQLQQLKQYYQPHLTSSVPYSVFRAVHQQTTITAYASGKVLFQGNHTLNELQQLSQQFDWITPPQACTKTTPNTQTRSVSTMVSQQYCIIGSDEVGNGSYFGSLVVASVYLRPEDIDWVKALKVNDSKKLTDPQIEAIAPKLMERLFYNVIEVSPKQYNKVMGIKYNAVSLKVMMHYTNCQQLLQKIENQPVERIIIDQFTTPKNFYHYLTGRETIDRSLILFKTQAESQYLSVACASIIARHLFLESLRRFGAPYQCTLPSGAGTQVDQVGRELTQKYGAAILDEIAKLHFRNTEKILN